MEAETRRTLRIDTRLEAYNTFFDETWAKEVFALVRGTTIDEPVFDLMASWRAVANTHRMPLTMMKMLQSLWSGAVSGQSLTQIQVGQIHRRLCKEVPDLTVTKKQKIHRAMLKIRGEISHIEASLDDGFPGSDLWDDLVQTKKGIEFQLGIWGSQRLCYPALYHAYENLLRDVMSVRAANPLYRIPRYEQFLRDAEVHLGAAVVADCLTHPEVSLARLVRNSFAHKGGKLTNELRKLVPLPFEIEGDAIQIMAPDTTGLFNLLKVRVRRLAEAAIAPR